MEMDRNKLWYALILRPELRISSAIIPSVYCTGSIFGPCVELIYGTDILNEDIPYNIIDTIEFNLYIYDSAQ